MGRLIRLDREDVRNDDWTLPGYLCWYDQRNKPWPNELFPHELHVNDFVIQGPHKILIRRFIEQECLGDIAIEKTYTENTLMWNLWIQLAEDRRILGLFLRELLHTPTEK